MMPTNIIDLQTRKRKATEFLQRQQMTKRVFQELKDQTGIDYYKLLSGDEAEKRKAKFQDYQDSFIR